MKQNVLIENSNKEARQLCQGNLKERARQHGIILPFLIWVYLFQQRLS